MSNAVAIELLNIRFGYLDDTLNLDNITCKIYQNEYVCIVGHNGSGKSTLSKIMTGILRPKSGIFKIFDKEVKKNNVRTLCQNIGVVFQNPDNQFIGLSVEDDIAFGLENKGIDPKLMPEIINKVAKQMRIEDLLSMSASILSGGQKQRVAIAGILAMNPEIIIFDESTSMLDPKAKNELRRLMLDLKNNFNKTVISITHDMEELINADRVIVLKKGKIIEQGKPIDIFMKKDFITLSSLALPFCLTLVDELNKIGIKVNSSMRIDEILNQLV